MDDWIKLSDRRSKLELQSYVVHQSGAKHRRFAQLLRIGATAKCSCHVRQVIAAYRSVWVRIVEIVHRAPEKQTVAFAKLVIEPQSSKKAPVFPYKGSRCQRRDDGRDTVLEAAFSRNKKLCACPNWARNEYRSLHQFVARQSIAIGCSTRCKPGKGCTERIGPSESKNFSVEV